MTLTCALCHIEYESKLGHACVSLGTADIDRAFTSLALIINTEPAAREITVTRIEPVLAAFQALRCDVKAFAAGHGVRGATGPGHPSFNDVRDHVNAVMRAWIDKSWKPDADGNSARYVAADRNALVRSELMTLITKASSDDREAIAVLLQDASVALDAMMSDHKQPPTFDELDLEPAPGDHPDRVVVPTSR